MKTIVPAFERVTDDALRIVHRHFDIVNGFFNRCRAGSIDLERWFAIDRVMTINASNIWLRKKTIIRIIAALNEVPPRGLQDCRWWCGLSSVR